MKAELSRTIQARRFTFQTNAALIELIRSTAGDRGLCMNELISTLVATALDRPDLAFIPRISIGRPRRDKRRRNR